MTDPNALGARRRRLAVRLTVPVTVERRRELEVAYRGLFRMAAEVVEEAGRREAVAHAELERWYREGGAIRSFPDSRALVEQVFAGISAELAGLAWPVPRGRPSNVLVGQMASGLASGADRR